MGFFQLLLVRFARKRNVTIIKLREWRRSDGPEQWIRECGPRHRQPRRGEGNCSQEFPPRKVGRLMAHSIGAGTRSCALLGLDELQSVELLRT
jgi:hypothetical protein